MIVLILAACAANLMITFYLFFSHYMDDSRYKKGYEDGRKEWRAKGYLEGFDKAPGNLNISDYETGYILGRNDAKRELKEQQKNNQQ